MRSYLTDENWEEEVQECMFNGLWTCPECGNQLEPDADCEPCQVESPENSLICGRIG